MTEHGTTEFHKELKRQSVHFLAGLFCIAAFILLGKTQSIALFILLLIAGYFFALRIKHRNAHPFLQELLKHTQRSHEEHFPGLPVFLFLAGAILTIGLFSNYYAALSGLIVLTFGDSMATIIGKFFGNIKLVSNRTLEGTIAGIGLSTITLLFLFQAPYAIIIATIGMLAEYLPIDDNIGIPLTAAITATLLL